MKVSISNHIYIIRKKRWSVSPIISGKWILSNFWMSHLRMHRQHDDFDLKMFLRKVSALGEISIKIPESILELKKICLRRMCPHYSNPLKVSKGLRSIFWNNSNIVKASASRLRFLTLVISFFRSYAGSYSLL